MTRPRASGWLTVLDDADVERAAGRAVWASACGYDGYARHGGEGPLAAFTGSGSAYRSRPCPYPTWAQGG